MAAPHNGLTAAHIRRWLTARGVDEPLLLGVSGGLDSSVLWHLVHETGVAYDVAHVNYNLRGDASAGDEAHVAELAAARHCKLHLLRDDSLVGGANTQEAAREIRYAYFSQVISTGSYAAVAVAHHADDQLETMLLALLRGAGPGRLAGMRTVQGKVVRPLLDWPREALMTYAREHDLTWREDASNASDDYLRNAVRHRVVPRLMELEPRVLNAAGRSSHALESLIDFAQHQLARFGESLLDECGGTRLSRVAARANPSTDYFLFETLLPLGFARATVVDIVTYVNGESTEPKVFESNSRDCTVRCTNAYLELVVKRGDTIEPVAWPHTRP